LELADMVAGLAAGVEAAGVVGGAEVVVAGVPVGEQVPDDDQDGAGGGDQGFELAAALDQPPVPLAQEGVGLASRGGRVTEDAFQAGAAFGGGVVIALRP